MVSAPQEPEHGTRSTDAAHMENRKKLAWCLGALLVAPLVLEGAARLRSYLRYGSTYDVFDLYESVDATGLRVPIKGLRATLAKTARIEIDSRGFRNPELVQPKPAGTVRLAFLGASPVFCVEVGSNASTWPHLVREGLASAHPGQRFDYINAAVSAYSVADSHVRLVQHVQPLDPDVVIIYHATRDLSADSFELAHEAGLISPREPGFFERHSFLVQQLLLNVRYWRAQRAGRSAAEAKLEVDPDTLARPFGHRLTALVAAARQTADCVVLVTFATRGRRDQSRALLLDNMAHAFTFTPYLSAESILDCYDAYNAEVRRAAHDGGALLLEAAPALPGTAEYFVDSVHLTEAGCRAMAKLIADGLSAWPQFGSLLGVGEPREGH
ncbi:MAG: GDSL-type esterase/lipase family protein [Planctomycetota bacterium]